MHLLQRWQRLWEQSGACGDPATVFDLLDEYYRDPRRAYHNWDHIAHCLHHLDETPQQPSWVLEWALWFHDVIYESGGEDNEQRSANLAVSSADRAGLCRLDELEGLILATAHTPRAPAGGGSTESRLIADIDLVILGESPARFEAYEQAIRREYAAVPETSYTYGRARLLANFLHRPYIYASRHFRDRFEEQARINIMRSLKKLGDTEEAL